MTTVVVVLLVTAALLAARFGADSRDGGDWAPASPGGPLRTGVRRSWRALGRFLAAQSELWERYLQAQRPWEQEQLHWIRQSDGWHLAGDRLPPNALRHRRTSG